jgi:hypothetical protein
VQAAWEQEVIAMTVRGVITAILVVLFTTTVSWAQGGGAGGGGGFGGTSVDLLLPGPPSDVTATAGNSAATVSFKPPKSDGGNPITGYIVASHPMGMKASGKQSPITVKGLANGKTYTFTVSATNSVGTGLDSPPSNCITPRAD